MPTDTAPMLFGATVPRGCGLLVSPPLVERVRARALDVAHEVLGVLGPHQRRRAVLASAPDLARDFVLRTVVVPVARCLIGVGAVFQLKLPGDLGEAAVEGIDA